MSARQRFLVVRLSALGDVVLTTPLLRAIRHAYPNASITVATKHAYAPLIEPNPHVDRVVALRPGEPVAESARRLAGHHYDHLIDLQQSPRTWRLRHLLGGRWSTHDKGRVAAHLLIWTGVDRIRPTPVAERYFDPVRGLGVTPDGGPAELFPTAVDIAKATAVAPAPPFVILAPGARHRSKQWPAPHWRDLARRLTAQGLRVVGLGLPEDAEVFAKMQVIPAFELPLGAVAALVQRAAGTVANDSGIMHIATAVDTPVVAIFGPTVPEFGFAPYRARAVVLEHPLPCRPCTRFGGPRCPAGHHRCLADILPAEVEQSLTSLVAATGAVA